MWLFLQTLYLYVFLLRSQYGVCAAHTHTQTGNSLRGGFSLIKTNYCSNSDRTNTDREREEADKEKGISYGCEVFFFPYVWFAEKKRTVGKYVCWA